jgi:hypothetical protein
MDTIEVRVGQVWADNDSRCHGRTLRIDAVDGDTAVCTVLTNTTEVQAYVAQPASKPTWTKNSYRDRRGTRTRIKLSRFRPTATGYKLVRDYMACPRQCGVDVRNHHSTTTVNGRCDTGPLSLEAMTAWFELRGAGQPGFPTTAELVAAHYGKTEDELEALYAAMHGSMA